MPQCQTGHHSSGARFPEGWLTLKIMFAQRLSSFAAIPMLALVLLVSGCATQNQSAFPDSKVITGSEKTSDAFKAFSSGIRQNPMFDAYAKRYPKQWNKNVGALWPKVRRVLSGRNPLQDRAASAELAKTMRTSDLMKDLAIVQREAMARLSAQHATKINALGIEHMTYLRNRSPEACAKLLLAQPSSFEELSPELRVKQQVLIGEMIAQAPKNRGAATDSKVIKRIFGAIDLQLKQKFANYPGWDKLNLSTTDAAVMARNCDYSIEHSKIVAKFPAQDRLAIVRFTRRAVSSSSSLEAWETRVYRIAKTNSVHIVGPMHLGMVRNVEKLIKENPGLDSVLLDSPGGLIIAGQRLAALIEARQMTTQVSHICMSACTIALLAGKERIVGEASLIGFHDSVVSGASLAAVGASDDYYTRLYGQLPQAFIKKVKATPNESMWIPSKQELLDAKVITSLSQIKDAGPVDLQLAEAELENAMLATELAHNNQFWSNEKDRLTALKEFGATDQIIRSYIRDDHLASMRIYWKKMPEELVERAALTTVEKIIAIKNDVPELCVDVFVGSQLNDDQNARFSEQLQLQSKQLNRDLIKRVGYLQASDSRISKPTSKDFQSLLPVFSAQPRRDVSWFFESLKAQRKPLTDPANCQVLANLMKTLIAQPASVRAKNFRLLQRATIAWKNKNRYGNPLPFSRSLVGASATVVPIVQ